MTFLEECQSLYDVYSLNYRQGNAIGCASVYADNAELYSPYGPPSIGRQAIIETHKEWFLDDTSLKNIHVSEAGKSINLGWCVAHSKMGEISEAMSLNVLELQPDGHWLITHCSLNDATF